MRQRYFRKILQFNTPLEFLIGIIAIPNLAGKLLIALDKTLYGKAGKKILDAPSILTVRLSRI